MSTGSVLWQLQCSQLYCSDSTDKLVDISDCSFQLGSLLIVWSLTLINALFPAPARANVLILGVDHISFNGAQEPVNEWCPGHAPVDCFPSIVVFFGNWLAKVQKFILLALIFKSLKNIMQNIN